MKIFIATLMCISLSLASLQADIYPDPSLDPADVIAPTPGLTIYHAQLRDFSDGKFGVCIPTTYKADKPTRLIVSSHGNGGDGEKEANSWKGLAEKYGIIVVCPSYRSPSYKGYSGSANDEKMLTEIMTRVFGSLNIDRAKVLHTGFSGGSLATWYVAAKHDDWFTALCLRSGNFWDEPRINLSKWRDRPIYIFWGEKDLPNIPGEGERMLSFVQHRILNQTVKHDIVPEGHHESHPDLVAKWFAGLTDADFNPSDDPGSGHDLVH